MVFSKLSSKQFAGHDERMAPEARLREVFKNYPAVIHTTEQLLEQCSIDFDFKAGKNKKTFSQSRYDDKQLLEKLAMDGMCYRYGRNNPEAVQRVQHELEIIDQLGFSAYFLIAWDIIRYSMSRGFYQVGRGSGANSIVAYCLMITDVDPISLNLYFERFLNPRRSSPPDFDIDYSWKDRGQVQDYIFRRYGRDHTALLGATSTFRDKSIIRELGKVFGLPKVEIELLLNDPGNDCNKNDVSILITTLGQQMIDFPNLRTIHAGGILISEEPLTCYTALDLPPKGFPTTQWDMYIAEDMGFEKLDILSQRGIGHIREAVEIIRENRGDEVDVHRVQDFFHDEKVKQQLSEGETNGCFYIESPAMRGLLKKLECHDYITLVAASSIIRPGVARSGMMREYIRRFHNPDDFEYIHPVLKEQLEETYESFAGYSFSKAHSASYAVESFQSLFLKAHYPLEFQVAVINNFGGFFHPWVYFNEAQRQGGKIERPCVNNSRKYTRIVGRTIYMGFVHIQNLDKLTVDLVETERNGRGEFRSFIDFMERVPVTKEQLIVLIRVGALRFCGKAKSTLLWEAHLHLKRPVLNAASPSIFAVPLREFVLPVLEHSWLEDAYDEIELLGFPVSVDNFDLLKTSFRGDVRARQLPERVGMKVRIVGRLVTIKYVHTSKGEIMHFGCFVDHTGEFFDTVHFPGSLKEYPFQGYGIYLLLGKIVEEFGFPSIEVEKMARLPYHPKPNM